MSEAGPENTEPVFLTETIKKLSAPWSLPTIDLKEEINYFHPWLEKEISDLAALDPAMAALAGAIFPIQNYGAPIDRYVLELRKNPGLRKYLSEFSKLEYLTMTASIRGIAQTPDWYCANRDDLLYWVGEATN